jgi:hypothetical protein
MTTLSVLCECPRCRGYDPTSWFGTYGWMIVLPLAVSGIVFFIWLLIQADSKNWRRGR